MRSPWLCILIVSFLGLGALGGMAGLVTLAARGQTAPESLVAAVSLCLGSLASFLVSPPRGSLGIDNPRRTNPQMEQLLETTAAVDRHVKANEMHAATLKSYLQGMVAGRGMPGSETVAPAPEPDSHGTAQQ